MLADTSMERCREKMVAVSGIAPDSSRLQRDANLSQLHSRIPPSWANDEKRWRSARDSNPGHHCRCDCFQDSVLDPPDALRLFENGSPAWTRTTTSRLTDGHAALTSLENGSSAWNRTKVIRLSGGSSPIELRRIWKMVARPGAAPGASSFQTRRVC